MEPDTTSTQSSEAMPDAKMNGGALSPAASSSHGAIPKPKPLGKYRRSSSDQPFKRQNSPLDNSSSQRRTLRGTDGSPAFNNAVVAAARLSKKIGKKLSSLSEGGSSRKRDEDADDKGISPIVMDPHKYLQKVITPDSAPFLSQFMESPIPAPAMARNALLMGDLVQQGDFHDISEVHGFKSRNPNTRQYFYGLKSINPRLLKAATEGGPQRHSQKDLVKFRQQQAIYERELEQAVVRMVVEALYIGHLTHPHILKLRGVAMGGMASDPEASFLLTDRIAETLDQRIETWKDLAVARAKDERKRQRMIQYPPLAPPTNMGTTSLEQMMRDPVIRSFPLDLIVLKTNYAVQILDALQYLHQKGIVVRELRPESIGFCPYPYHHTVQLCDLSSCREVPKDGSPIEPEMIWGEDHRPSLLTTSMSASEHKKTEMLSVRSHVNYRRYMAPEMFGQVGYNTKADLYSWAMICSELVTENKPYTSRQVMRDWEKITKGELRPKLQKYHFPRTVKAIIEQAWHANISRRASAKQLARSLRVVLYTLEGQGLPWVVNGDERDEVENEGKEQEEEKVESDQTLSSMTQQQKSSAPTKTQQKSLHLQRAVAYSEFTLPQRAAKYKRWEEKDGIGWGNLWDSRVGFNNEMNQKELDKKLREKKKEVFDRRFKAEDKQVHI